jgi:glycosyltransferase involved in cell wall biosynthesis
MFFFSVIIPCFNRAHLIEDSIRSVLNNSFDDFEIIIVDDGSTDTTAEVVKYLLSEKVKYYRIENSERGFARNYGVGKSSGEYVTFLDSDDLFYPNHLQNAYTCLQKNKFPEWFHSRYEFYDSETGIKKPQDLISSNPNLKLIKGNFLSCQAVFLKRTIALQNPFCENRLLSTLEDWELWLRIAAQYPLCFSNEISSALVQHPQRSVMDVDVKKLIAKFDLFQQMILNNKLVLNFFNGKIYQFKSSCSSYISLHIALSKKNRGKALSYLLRSLMQNPLSIFSRRFGAILKHLV